MAEGCHLLSDEEVASFIDTGYHVVTPTVAPDVHAAITEQADRMQQGGGVGTAAHQDLFSLHMIPAFDEVVRDPAVCGALQSLLGSGYKLQTHRTNHYKQPHQGDQAFHVDGQFRNLDQGWFRNYRRWHRIRKLICFYYPHEVTTAPSAIVPRGQYLTRLTEEQEAEGESLFVPAGSFVLLHYSMWHRGTAETLGERRVMLKLLFDRTEEPAAPSWNHIGQYQYRSGAPAQSPR